jgi:hypothetical protein
VGWRCPASLIRPSFYTGVGARFAESGPRGFLRVVARGGESGRQRSKSALVDRTVWELPAWGVAAKTVAHSTPAFSSSRPAAIIRAVATVIRPTFYNFRVSGLAN